MSQVTEHLAPAVFRSGDAAPSAECLHGWIDAGLTRHRADASVCRCRQIDHPWIDLTDVRVTEAQPLHRTGAHVLHENVTLLDNLQRDGAVSFFLEVQLDHP